MKYIVFGDTGGHYRQLHAALREIGMTEDYILPEDIHIIHLGDLVHKGLYSTDILRMIDEIRILNDGQWTQLIGNHEAQYLGGHLFWNKRIDAKGISILHEWYQDGFLKYIHMINTFDAEIITETQIYKLDAPIFFSHAGISKPFFDLKKNNGETTLKDIHKPGLMLGETYKPFDPVGPVWAHGVHEVWALWKDLNSIEFNQFVGHIAPYQFDRKAFYPQTLGLFKELAHLHEKEKAVVAPLNDTADKWMVFMDPGYSKYAPAGAQPYVVIETKD